ncbi:hypothetical protein N018_09710 [Pseudomonas syringae CC1557]|uniref:Uncharacterized protein n=1 Tax=Pseudomonas syringae CC1557 TaxID=1357279 RepID=W0MY82_PSESX|nr:hypothetical protein [Pseudomonas syringae]AHG43539.1 hypothetical protein N018_09710 [Pseudomonas syringae CC1557]
MVSKIKTGSQAVSSGHSKEALLELLNVRPSTLGWDAVVVYNRGRANALMMQQYIQKLTAENYLQPIDGEINSESGSNLKFFGIQLGIPRLSFENASLTDSRARVTLPIIGGLAILKSEPVGGYKGIHSIMRPNGAAGPRLWLDVTLKDAPGGVDEVGSVKIDLSDMNDFDTDLFSDPVSIINAREFFETEFKKHPELQVYTLGTLSQQADSTLKPKSFSVHTQAAPGAKLRSAPNYGDGAVVLFVTLEGGVNGGIPASNSDFEYMIPDDEEGRRFSSAVLVSNRVFLTTLLRTQLESVLPGMIFTVKNPTDADGNPLHSFLEITGGEISKADYKYVNQGYFSDHIITATNPMLTLNLTGAAFRAENNTCTFTWHNDLEKPMHFWNTRGADNDSEYDASVYFSMAINLTSVPSVNPQDGIISFEQAEITDIQIGVTTKLNEYAQNTEKFHNHLRQVIYDHLFAFTKKITLPDIDTFLLRNLLFPDLNSMVLTDVAVPGDLAVFGNVNPSMTSFVISPESPVLNTGGIRKFVTDPVIGGVEWSCRALPGDTTGPIGSFSANGDGTYTAPSADVMAGREAQQVIVTAKGTVNGLEVSSAALVSIVNNTISVNPLFQVASAGLSLPFTAGTLDDRKLIWAMKDPGQNGQVIPDQEGRGASYTAPLHPEPPAPVTMFVLDVIQVTDDENNMGQAHVLVINKTLGGQVEVDLTNATSGTAQLQFMKQYDSGPIAVPHQRLKWTLLAGGGSVDAVGLYLEPEQQLPGFAIVTCAFEREPDFPGAPIPVDYGYTVLPLPLGAYPDLGRAYS